MSGLSHGSLSPRIRSPRKYVGQDEKNESTDGRLAVVRVSKTSPEAEPGKPMCLRTFLSNSHMVCALLHGTDVRMSSCKMEHTFRIFVNERGE